MAEQESRLEGILDDDISSNKVDVLGTEQKVPQSRVEAMLSSKFSEIDAKMATFVGGVKFEGTTTFANLPSNPEQGQMYNVSDPFTTTSAFREGAGVFCAAGTNVVWDGEYWDIFTPSTSSFYRDVVCGSSPVYGVTRIPINDDTSVSGYKYSSTISWPGVTDKDIVDLELLDVAINDNGGTPDPVLNLDAVDLAVESITDNVKVYYSDMYKTTDGVPVHARKVELRIYLTKVQEIQ